jgi:peptidoglycan/xylan/chitin deacetylase (PgdA/CDA1 family)
VYYTIHPPYILRLLYRKVTWKSHGEKVIYLTFDDGPHPTLTPHIINLLEQYKAKGTFFCIGENVKKYPEVYASIISNGHKVGNHTHRHLNGWKTLKRRYLEDIRKASELIDSKLFRPPYGRITPAQLRAVKRKGMQPVMWSVLSGDFDKKLSPEKCAQNVIQNAGPGSVIVFHDSDKASDRMLYALPKVLEHFSALGYVFKGLE